MSHSFSAISKEFNPRLTNVAYLIRKRLLQGIVKHIHHMSGSMMDFGCGSKPYKSLFSVEEYVGVDFNGDGHSHANEQIDVFYDGKTLPFENNRFDSVFSSEVFEHVFNLEDMVKEINRVMKPGAKLLVTCPFAIAEHEQPNDFGRYTSFGFKDLLQRNGFEVVVFDKVGTPVETVCQLFISYVYIHIIRRFFGKIPVVRTGIRVVLVFLMNIASILWNFILPKGQDLYMNNVVVAVKKQSNL